MGCTARTAALHFADLCLSVTSSIISLFSSFQFFVSCHGADGGDDVSLSSLMMDAETRTKLANLGSQISTTNKGGYKGLGLLSELEAVKEVDSYDCNAAITAALLTGGATSLFENKSPKKGDKAEFKKTVIKQKKKLDGTERDIFKKLDLKYKVPQDVLDRQKMRDTETKYA